MSHKLASESKSKSAREWWADSEIGKSTGLTHWTIDEELSVRVASDDQIKARVAIQADIRDEGEASLEDAFTRFLLILGTMGTGSAALLMYTDDKEIVVYGEANDYRIGVAVTSPGARLTGGSAYRLYNKIRGWYQIALLHPYP